MKKTFFAIAILTLLIMVGMSSAFCEDRYSAVVHVTKDFLVHGEGYVYLDCYAITFGQPYSDNVDTYYFPLVGPVYNYYTTARVVIGPYSGSDTRFLTINNREFYVHVSSSVPHYPPEYPEDPEE